MNPRVPVAVAAGCVFLFAWVVAAMILSDRIMGAGTAVQLVYFALAGSLWVLPIAGLMFWAARSRSGIAGK
jgi:hypothetical protein